MQNLQQFVIFYLGENKKFLVYDMWIIFVID
jgi:hypothetical protein